MLNSFTFISVFEHILINVKSNLLVNIIKLIFLKAINKKLLYICYNSCIYIKV